MTKIKMEEPASPAVKKTAGCLMLIYGGIVVGIVSYSIYILCSL